MKQGTFFIGELARRTGTNPKTLRYYEDIDLLPRPKRGENNYRIYSRDALKRLEFIKKAQTLGFTLREIKEILALRDTGITPCNHVRELLQRRIVDIDLKLSELTNLRRELKKLEHAWAKMKTVEDDRDGGICPQIEGTGSRLKTGRPRLSGLKK